MRINEASPLAALMDTFPYPGRLELIALRPARGAPVVLVEQARLQPGKGLEGDRFAGREQSKRQVTLIQAEHLAVVAGLLQLPGLAPLGSSLFIEEMAARVRRNLVVSGINLLALKGRTFRLGEALLEYTGPCEPCSKMELALGPGGYNALRGHGDITARVLLAGTIGRGDGLIPQP